MARWRTAWIVTRSGGAFLPAPDDGRTMFEVAVVGLGGLGLTSATAAESIDGVAVVAGADPDPTAREAFAEEFDGETYADHESLIESHDVDAALINTPHALHYAGASDFLGSGAHVHLEKPFVTSFDDGVDLVERADDVDLALGVGYQRRFDPRYREIRRIVASGRIGRVHMIAAHLEQRWREFVADSWRTDPALSGGGQLSDSGSHLLDALLWASGTEPTAVAAVVDERETDVDVNAALSVELRPDARSEPAGMKGDGGPAERVTASIGVSGEGTSTPGPGERLELFGTDGRVAFDGETITVVEGDTEWTASPAAPGFEELTRRKLANFVSAARGEESLRSSGRDALGTVALTAAAYESATTGERVPVPEFPRISGR